MFLLSLIITTGVFLEDGRFLRLWWALVVGCIDAVFLFSESGLVFEALAEIYIVARVYSSISDDQRSKSCMCWA